MVLYLKENLGGNMFKKSIWLLTLSLLISSVFPYIVKIGKEEISRKDFQDFIDVQKFIDNEDSFDGLARKKKTTKNNILTDYIDQLIVIREAKKKGYNEKNDLIKKAFDTKKEQWVTTLYVAKNVDIESLSVKETDIRNVYKQLPSSSKTKPYNQLTEQEKKGLYQIATIKAAQDKKKEFQKVLEKKYKVKRYGINKKVVAMVESKKVTKNEFQKKVDEQLARLGITEKEVKDRDPKRFDQARKDILDEIIFEKLIDLDIKKSGFKKNRLVVRAYDFLMDQVISEQFILNEIASKMKISSHELDEAFIQVSQQNPAIKNMLPTEQERVLRKYIIQAKLPEIIKDYLVEVKEGILIKRNKEELSKIS